MKKLLITSILFLAFSSIIWSQKKLSLDIQMGLSAGATPKSAYKILNRENPHDEILFDIIHVNPQYSAGFRIHKELGTPFFLEGGLTYTKKTSQYQVDYRMPQPEPVEQQNLMSLSEDIIQLPLQIGVNLGNFDVTSGLMIMKSISEKNELSHLKGYTEDGNALKWGWQMGVRYGFKRAMAGVEYQGSMHRVCEGMYVNDNSMELMNVPGRFVFTLQYRL